MEVPPLPPPLPSLSPVENEGVTAPDPRALRRALAVFGIWLGVILALLLLAPQGGHASLVTLVSHGLLVTPVGGLVFLALASLWIGWKGQGWRTAPWPGTLAIVWLPYAVILPVLALSPLFHVPANVWGWSAFNSAFAGLSEEWMFRGVLLKGLRSQLRLWPSVLLSSLLFGSVHTLNAFRTGDLKAALLQATAATVLGIILCAYRIRTRSLWPGIVTHWLWDFALILLAVGVVGSHPSVEQTAPDFAGSVAVLVVQLMMFACFLGVGLGYAIFLLRPGRLTAAQQAPCTD